MRTEPMPEFTDRAVWGSGYAFRRRADGGYTIAHGDSSIAEIVPDSFRLFRAFIPAMRTDWDKLKIRFGARFFEELARPRRWALDAPSPFETVRVLDPKPHAPTLDAALSNLRRAYPAFGEARIAERWAGLIDVTPDAVPVISHVDALPGLTIATGFSGHGFGIGPGAGRLVADMVSGTAEPAVLSAFRLGRFFDGSPIRPGPAV
jgi:glycine/D-amino acid oxidase-like deaminating enzyme